ncbi:hypothetical protein ACLQ2R_02035 [Streptosporangium sp. DT93]|uniref:hypothetical protein n=1 Tax=Streptosporangium sp. DT93 TaxID=3393428 RepID=UPI003CF0C8FE
MSERFRDPGTSWYDLPADEILVRCPRCDGRAAVRPLPGGESGLFAPRRLLCPACGYVRGWAGDRVGWYDEPADPYFRLPLWLSAPCCGHTLWAYGRRHLDLLEDHVAALRRERRLPPATGGGNHGRPRTLVESLPGWITGARHREEVLRVLARLRATLDVP